MASSRGRIEYTSYSQFLCARTCKLQWVKVQRPHTNRRTFTTMGMNIWTNSIASKAPLLERPFYGIPFSIVDWEYTWWRFICTGYWRSAALSFNQKQFLRDKNWWFSDTTLSLFHVGNRLNFALTARSVTFHVRFGCLGYLLVQSACIVRFSYVRQAGKESIPFFFVLFFFAALFFAFVFFLDRHTIDNRLTVYDPGNHDTAFRRCLCSVSECIACSTVQQSRRFDHSCLRTTLCSKRAVHTCKDEWEKDETLSTFRFSWEGLWLAGLDRKNAFSGSLHTECKFSLFFMRKTVRRDRIRQSVR